MRRLTLDTDLDNLEPPPTFEELYSMLLDHKSLKTPVYYIGRPKRGLFERILKGRWK